MKKKIILLVSIISILVLIFISSKEIKYEDKEVIAIPVSSEEEAKNEFNDYLDKQLEDLDVSEIERYIDSLSDEQKSLLYSNGITETIRQIMSGEYKVSYSSYINSILSFVFKNVIAMIPNFAVILAVCIVMGIFKNLQSGFMENGTSRLIFFICYSSIVLVLFSMLVDIIQSSYQTANSVQKQIEVVFPILLSLMALSGGNVSVAIYQPTVAFLSVVIVRVITEIIFPLTVLVIVLGLVSGINNDIKLKNFCEFFKSINKWVLGITLTAFTVFFTLQGISATGFDGISFKAIKYAISSSIPLVGGFFSSGFDLVVASSIMIKNALGIYVVLLLVSIILVPLVSIIAFSLFLKLICAVVEPLGDNEVCALLTDLSKSVGYFVAGILSVAFMYVVVIFLMICSSSFMV